jgi:hypothetical protein
MKDLFYSNSEKKLFWIAGYNASDNSTSVKEIISVLKNNAEYFIRNCKLPSKALINTDYITNSSRYKNMRYFWVNDIENPPLDAFVLGSDWTMQKWINN